MTSVPSASAPLLDEEAPFRPEELFFSRTDERGIIRAGNAVFQRISRFDWSELLGAPHKIIRHPHMPRAVFRLLWDEIQAGRPIGAYVKNRAKDGRYYWVFAVVTPIDGGYLSVRLKPSSALLPVVARLYADTRRRELEEALSPEDGVEALAAAVEALGHDTYDGFMAVALAREIEARDALTGPERLTSKDGFGPLLKGLEALRTEAAAVLTDFDAVRLAPTNLRIQTRRLGAAAAAVDVIATNYELLAYAIDRSLRDFLVEAERMRRVVHRGMFLIGTARLQEEVGQVFAAEGAPDPRLDQAAEAARLEQQRLEYRGLAAEGLRDLAQGAARFAGTCAGLGRVVAGLDVTRVLCAMEQARLGVAAAALDETTRDLDRCRKDIERRLGEINRVTAALREAARDRVAALT